MTEAAKFWEEDMLLCNANTFRKFRFDFKWNTKPKKEWKEIRQLTTGH